MKKTQIILLLSVTSLLASCGNQGSTPSSISSIESIPTSVPSTTPSSEPTSAPTSEPASEHSETSTPLSEESMSSSEEEFPSRGGGQASFAQVCDFVRDTAIYEAYGSTEAHVINSQVTGNYSDVLDETYTMFSGDGGCQSSGSVVEKIGDKVEIQDNIVRRKIVKDEQFTMDDGTVGTFPMFIDVTDYQKDEMVKYAYQDSAEMLFVVDSYEEAEEAGLDDSQYVLSVNSPLMITANVTSALYYFVGYILYENVYLSQTGATTFTYSFNNTTNGFDFTYHGSYTLEGDLDDEITYTYDVSFSTSEDGFLTSVLYSTQEVDQDKSNPEDVYSSTSTYSAEISYGLRTQSAEGSVDVDDYFLSTVNEIEFYQPSNSKVGISDTVIYDGNFLFLNGRAIDYTPAKAMDILLTPSASSNEEVAKITKGGDAGYIIEIVGFGSAEITFTYSGRIDGVFTACEFKKTINVNKPAPTTIVLPSSISNSLKEGESTSFSVTVLPSTSDKDITVSVDDDKVIQASVEKGTTSITVNALKAGTATLTIASTANPSVTQTVTFTVVAAATDYSTILVSKTWHSETKRVYGYLLDLVFKKDGTAEQTYTVTSSGATFVDTYNWTIEGNKFTFTNPSSGAYPVIYDGIYDATSGGLTINAQGEATIYYSPVE